MCGIFGIYRPTSRLDEPLRAWAHAAQVSLRHRGPDGDDQKDLLDGRAILGHTRLSIIDLEGGAQPLTNEDETIWLVCNGEIYNYIELREQLIARGHRFRTHSDCEVLIHLYEDHGPEFVDQLVGMYGLALFDLRNQRLVLARDAFGEKPVYYAPLPGGGLAFASELKALAGLPGLDDSLDVAALAQFLALRYIPAPRTHLAGVRKLRAGEALIADATGKISERRYWLPELSRNGFISRERREAAVEQIQQRVRQSVRLRLRSDVPVGAFLSGGIDSTFIVTAMRELEPAAELRTFCATFDDDSLNEAPYARQIAEHVGSLHHEVHFTADEVLSCFNALIDHFDEPFADASMFPTFAVCHAARQDCKVMLSGDGGDECFRGYREFFRYWSLHSLRRFPGVNQTASAVEHVWPESMRGIGPLKFLSRDDWQLLYPQAEQNAVALAFRPEARAAAVAGLEELRVAALHHARLAYPRSVVEATAQAYLPEQILVKVDRASMRSALECRAPFLDRSLFEYVKDLPESFHFERGMGKALLRKALPAWVPDEIRWREKRGFTPPLARWFRTNLRAELDQALSGFSPALDHLLDPEPARKLFDQHQAGEDRSDLLLRWLVLSRRCREARSG
jgi:asparagine synthase (glutamine-hydrolysing)